MRRIMKRYLYILCTLYLTACASHQYDGLMMDEKSGVKYKISGDVLSIQFQNYQFYPNTVDVLVECKNISKKLALSMDIIVPSFDYVTERNPLLGLTSCIAVGEIKSTTKQE
jgi:hypothetical protein